MTAISVGAMTWTSFTISFPKTNTVHIDVAQLLFAMQMND